MFPGDVPRLDDPLPRFIDDAAAAKRHCLVRWRELSPLCLPHRLLAGQRAAEVFEVCLPAGAVAVQLDESEAALFDHEAGFAASVASQASISASSSVSGSIVSRRWCGRSQASMRPGPIQVLVKVAWMVPPTHRSSETLAMQRARRSGLVQASQRSSMLVS